jgi:hypothetical protein
MYPDFNRTARDIILYFLALFFPDKEHLLTPIVPIRMETDRNFLAGIFTGISYEENYKILIHQIRKYNEHIPPLVNAYMNLSPTMRTFGTSINAAFGDVEETGILISIEDIYPVKKERHLISYMRWLSSLKSLKLHLKK